MLDELFGNVWARRLRIAGLATVVVFTVAGAAVFVWVSQSVGSVLFVPGYIGGWLVVLLRGDDEPDPLETVRRRRRCVVAIAATLATAGWALFLFVDGDAGLLLLLSAFLTLVPLLAGATHGPPSPPDGPPYGETHH